ncbi:hypothetical protein [Burkholderia sp. Bp8963]|uniref:hypothetical protein n=1 Tax=Burkholderia sp. Bp8963 TaxID=2184547 RepID=UPI000F5ADC83|nr:hypothetical protein [Burkholderia sp. Bp8963]
MNKTAQPAFDSPSATVDDTVDASAAEACRRVLPSFNDGATFDSSTATVRAPAGFAWVGIV